MEELDVNNNWSEACGDDYSNSGGCGILHMFDEKKREECNAAYAARDPKLIQAQADLLASQALGTQAAKASTDSSWTAGQTMMVVAGSLIVVGALVFFIIRAKRKKAQ